MSGDILAALAAIVSPDIKYTILPSHTLHHTPKTQYFRPDILTTLYTGSNVGIPSSKTINKPYLQERKSKSPQNGDAQEKGDETMEVQQ